MVNVLRDVLEISRIQKLRKELKTPPFSTLLLEGIKVTFRRLIVLLKTSSNRNIFSIHVMLNVGLKIPILSPELLIYDIYKLQRENVFLEAAY